MATYRMLYPRGFASCSLTQNETKDLHGNNALKDRNRLYPWVKTIYHREARLSKTFWMATL